MKFLANGLLMHMAISVFTLRRMMKEHETSFLFFFDQTSLPEVNKERLGDGCYNVFLDVGANLGLHGRFLFEPEKYAQVARGIFDGQFGARRDNRNTCVFAFEPNPNHKLKLQSNALAYQQLGWRYEVISAAVGDEDGTMEFNHIITTMKIMRNGAFSFTK